MVIDIKKITYYLNKYPKWFDIYNKLDIRHYYVVGLEIQKYVDS